MKGLFKDLSLAQLTAGALAAATSILLSSKIGIAGSLIGVVVGSVVSAVSTSLYKKAIAGSADALKQSLGINDEAQDTGEAAASEVPLTGDVGQFARIEEPQLGAHAQGRGTAAWSVEADRADVAEATAAIDSLDRDPTMLVGEGGATLYPAANEAYSQGTRTERTSGDAARYSRTQAYGSGYGRASTAAYTAGNPHARNSSSPDRTVAMPSSYGARSSVSQGASYAGPSAYASVATHEAQARSIARKNRLIGVVTVLSALAAVAVVFVLVNVLTSGDGIGYRPPSFIAPAASQQAPEAPTSTDASASDAQSPATAPAGTDAAPTPEAAGTTTTPGEPEQEPASGSTPGADDAQGNGAQDGTDATAPNNGDTGEEPAGGGTEAGADNGAQGTTTTTGGTDATATDADPAAAGADEGAAEAA